MKIFPCEYDPKTRMSIYRFPGTNNQFFTHKVEECGKLNMAGEMVPIVCLSVSPNPELAVDISTITHNAYILISGQ